MGWTRWLPWALVLGLGCSASKAPAPAAPLAPPVVQPPVEQGERWGPRDDANTRRVLAIFRDMLIAQTGDAPQMRRDAHPKHHGCVQGRLTIEPSALAPSLRQGLFATPGEYPTWVRFSNGDPDTTRKDAANNFRGMAVKIMGVPYSSYLTQVGVEPASAAHDLVLLNSPNFFVRDSDEYVEFMDAVAQGMLATAGFAMSHGPLTKILQRSRKMKVGNVLDLDYHSATPYKLGDASMRMTMSSCRDEPEAVPRPASADFLGERLQASLAQGEACFVFSVQPNADPARNPIEDPSLIWDPEVSPSLEVGRLTLPRQGGVREAEAMALCEAMSFNPWRAPEANRPMGQVNRIRLEVYTHQYRFRTKTNGAEPPRPKGLD